jgi:hypothetical protein
MFATFKIVSYVVLAAMIVAACYAVVMTLRYWPGIGV